MWKIARDVLGDVNRMNEVIAANPEISPDRLREGQVIRLPQIKELRSRGTVVETTIHTVKDGETLASIARQYYGVEDWTRIQSHNLDQVKNPDQLKVGMRLKIPPGAPVRGRGDR